MGSRERERGRESERARAHRAEGGGGRKEEEEERYLLARIEEEERRGQRAPMLFNRGTSVAWNSFIHV